jgi:hypothetical protein
MAPDSLAPLAGGGAALTDGRVAGLSNINATYAPCRLHRGDMKSVHTSIYLPNR